MMEVSSSPISISHVVESLKENFLLNAEGEPFFIHINLSNMTCLFFSTNIIGDLRFHVNALRYKKSEIEAKTKKLKNTFLKNRLFLNWNESWETKAISLFLDVFKKNLQAVKITPVRKSELITGENRLIGTKGNKMAKDCKVLGDLNFRWLKDVRGDGNCYYRAVMCGYIETLLTEKPEYIEAYLDMITKGNKIFSFEEEEEKKARKLMLPVLEHLVKIRKSLGIQKALQEYFLDSISSDCLNSVIVLIHS